MKNELERQSERLNLIAKELDQAKEHALVAANHFTASEVPRACAHTLAVQGHLSAVMELLSEVAKLHATKARI